MKKQCEYCHAKNQEGEICAKCGAPLPEQDFSIWKSEPFFYNGYICYSLSNRMNETVEVQFWLGQDLIERIIVSRDVLEHHVSEAQDPMLFFWDLFLVAQGETEVLAIQEKNNILPATFEVRRIENPERERLFNAGMRELLEESRKAYR